VLAADITFAAFLFTDVEGSTALWQAHPQAMHEAMAAHDAIVRAAIERHGGRVVKGTGDGFHAAFDRADDAVHAMLHAQLGLADPAATAGVALRVRCGVHSGECWARDADYYGPEVNRAARIMNAAHGGQMLLSHVVAARLDGGLPDGADLRDLGRVRLRDLLRGEHVHQLVHPRLRASFPPLRSLETTPNNLVPQVNALVDREDALAHLPRLIDANRLVTLFGTGGVGKTRLSLQVAATVLEQFPDGVWFVDLSALTQPDLLPQALAAVLGVREEDGAPVQDALLRYVATRALLVILDNCEHVVDACAAFARRLLEAGPRVKILASSREVLRLSGEHVFHVPPLVAPDPSAHAQHVHADAVQLFFDRAKAAQPALRIDDAVERAAARICHHLDGLPLAIELAAARTRVLSVQALAERIDDRFRLLGRADRTHLPRQQTLRALIDWSWDLLPTPEQTLLMRLSVFAGGFTLDACEAVCAGDGVAADGVLDLLTALVEKSLVVADVDSDRFRLLGTVRQYAHDRLADAGGVVSVNNRHRDHYVAFAEAARPELAGAHQAAWLAKLDAERDNLVAAHAWSLHAGGDDEGGGALRLSFALRPYWINRGLPSLGLRFTNEALARSGEARRDFARCRALYDAGALLFTMGQYHPARERMGQSLELAQALGEVRWAAGVHQVLGMACVGDGDRQAADEHLTQGLAYARAAGDKRELAAACTALAQVRRMDARLDEATPLYQETLGLARELDDRESIALALLNLASVDVIRNQFAAARADLLEVLALEAETGSMRLAQCAFEVGSALAAEFGDASRCAHLLGAAEELTKATGLMRDPADEAFVAPRIAKARAAIGDAAFDRGRAAASGEAMPRAVEGLRAWLSGLPTG
jgi:predicted ATPase/class 3 adenylate cyclase